MCKLFTTIVLIAVAFFSMFGCSEFDETIDTDTDNAGQFVYERATAYIFDCAGESLPDFTPYLAAPDCSDGDVVVSPLTEMFCPLAWDWLQARGGATAACGDSNCSTICYSVDGNYFYNAFNGARAHLEDFN